LRFSLSQKKGYFVIRMKVVTSGLAAHVDNDQMLLLPTHLYLNWWEWRKLQQTNDWTQMD